ncbi:hypothetical protein M514_03232 [Trichuris suis]|uniref:C2H2-type domain-containing protein n=1 Tax=Trichuris suis TaxID=68888 RepID=A0A085MX15_9BILA
MHFKIALFSKLGCARCFVLLEHLRGHCKPLFLQALFSTIGTAIDALPTSTKVLRTVSIETILPGTKVTFARTMLPPFSTHRLGSSHGSTSTLFTSASDPVIGKAFNYSETIGVQHSYRNLQIQSPLHQCLSILQGCIVAKDVIRLSTITDALMYSPVVSLGSNILAALLVHLSPGSIELFYGILVMVQATDMSSDGSLMTYYFAVFGL